MTDPTDNIVLTGFMGTGKTTVGREIARLTGRHFVDTDVLIEERHGPIPDIFRADGEERFREIERAVAAELATASGLVVSTGGRLMLDPRNVDTLGAGATVVCLTAGVDVILDRVTRDGVDDRPLLAGDDPAGRVEDLLAERAAGYGAFPQVRTDGRTPTDIATEVCEIAGLTLN